MLQVDAICYRVMKQIRGAIMKQFWKTGRSTLVFDNDDYVECYYHSTCVFRWDKKTDIVTLKTGGYFTSTTKTRINQCSAYWLANQFQVFQRKREWYISIDGTEMLFLRADYGRNEIKVTAPHVESFDDAVTREQVEIRGVAR